MSADDDRAPKDEAAANDLRDAPSSPPEPEDSAAASRSRSGTEIEANVRDARPLLLAVSAVLLALPTLGRLSEPMPFLARLGSVAACLAGAGLHVAWSSGWFARVRRGTVAAKEDGLYRDGRLSIPRERIRDVSMASNEAHVRVDTGPWWPATTIQFESTAEASAFAERLNKVVARPRTTWHLARRAMPAVALTMLSGFASPMPSSFLGFAVAFAVGVAIAPSVTLGADGVAIRRGMRRRFIPWSKLEAVRVSSDGKLVFVLADGTEVTVPGGGFAEREDLRAVAGKVMRQLEVLRARAPLDLPAKVRVALEGGGKEGAPYRGSDAPEELVVAAALDVRLDPKERLAAVALLGDERRREVSEAVVAGSADPALIEALTQLAEGDGDASSATPPSSAHPARRRQP